MAGYDYNYRSGYSNGKGGGPFTNGWNKTSYTDGECRTIIVDADGTLRTIIGCDPFQKPGTYVTKRVLSPAKEYGYADDWRRPSSPVKGYGYAADDHKLHRLSSPWEGYGYAAADHKLHRPKAVYSDDKGEYRTPIMSATSLIPMEHKEQSFLKSLEMMSTAKSSLILMEEKEQSLVTLSANRTMRYIIDEYDMERPLHYL